MKWILSFILCVGLQAQAETTANPAELAVDIPEAQVSGSASSVDAALSPAELAVNADLNEATGSKATTGGTAPQAGIQNLKETEIPVHLESAKKAETHESPFLRIFLSLGIVAVLGSGAYYFIRKYRFSNDPKSQATQIKVLTQYYLGPKKSLAIVRVAGESILIGITDHNINMIKALSLLDEEIPEETPKEFQSIFVKKTKVEESPVEDAENRDEFSISGIKDFVSLKLKNMRNLE